MSVFTRRRSGLLLHLSSLPSFYAIGHLGRPAVDFLDFLHRSGQTLWQMLPVHPVGYGHSPYSSTSAFAGNPLFIDLEDLVQLGHLTAEDLRPFQRPTARVDYQHACRCRNTLLPRAAQRFFRQGDPDLETAYAHFCTSQAWWLNDYCLFQALREVFHDAPWTDWPAPLRDREETALRQWSERLGQRILELKYEQFVFFRQWQRLHQQARERGILLFGDVPFYVAHDSADLWCHRQLFRLDETGRPTLVAGVPPDYFSKTGQRWGNPVYDWAQHHREQFSWWRARMRQALTLFDVIRLDHFRGMAACWIIPSDAPDARHGHWEPSPGDELLEALQRDLGKLPLVAEDLGVITDDVTELRRRWRLPGMRILQFAFDSGPDNPYLPQNHTADSVIYTGTHDNNTCRGWWQELPPSVRDAARFYLQGPEAAICQEMVRLTLESVGIFSIVPVQDLLGLGAEARMNHPGTREGNWLWRLPADALTDRLAHDLLHLTVTSGRTG
ncbi:MAG: 4-alpha-glucanotransferase [Deltaproteobacteria bacterium]|nr:MAG: 4-alpha-glucanotransferase [Deltaproteobacteria bacterium]